MLNKNYFLVCLALCLFAFSSCKKENMDTTTNTEDETPVEVVECDGFSLLLVESEGTVGVEVIGGTAPYTYVWSTEETTSTITPEESGTYAVTVTDAEGCDVSEEITIEVETNDCDGFDANIAHDGEGQLTVALTAGTAPYSYVWSTDENTEAIDVDADGVYSLTVTDALGCTVIDEISVTLNSGECDNTLTLNAANTNTAIAFSAESEAHLWKNDCAEVSGGTTVAYNYIIVDVDWNNWGTGEDYSIFAISDGLPGISFGSNDALQVGDVLSPYFVGDDYFWNEAESTNYDLDNIQVTITESSTELGGQIAGTISGTIFNQNDENDSSTVSGSFCVTIATVCE